MIPVFGPARMAAIQSLALDREIRHGAEHSVRGLEMEKKSVYKEAVIRHQDYLRVIRFAVDEEIESDHQRITIGHNEYLGRLMVIDDEIQFSELDHSTYHELMVWPSMILRQGDNVAIYGGGDGLAAAEVLKFGVVPTIVDLDDSVIKVCRDRFSDLNHGSLDRAKIVIGDALQHRPKKKYDIIFVDLTDQVACPFLYDEAAIAKYKSDLARGGIILFYGERMLARSFYGRLGYYFNQSLVYGAFMEFVGSLFTFSMFSDGPLDAEKVKSSELAGSYFIGRHFHELDLGHLPKVDFPETFSLIESIGKAVDD